MGKVVGKIFIFLIILVALFMWVGSAITKMTGGEKKAGGKVEISPEGGETIYWGKGRCYTCHSIGDRGSAVRCPNHGVWGDKFPLAMGARAVERAKEREAKTGKPYTATDYLIESLADPGAYIVEGYKNEMAVVYAPPISLTVDEIKAVISYMQSQGGEVNIDAINTPTEISKKFWDRIQAAGAAGGGDPGHGEEVFKASCANCHMLKGQGGKAGPDLSSIGVKGIKSISESILQPAASFTPGYETYVVIGKDGKEMVRESKKVAGVKTAEDSESVEIAVDADTRIKVSKSEIKELVIDKNKSLMPEDMIEMLTVKDYQDVLAFMIMQKEKK
ncbi:MAG: c-type cytochrome [Deltaproteobacteria bacterium]|nr:c-type cytochrome [Deltaproteobacteria bacterium]